MTKTPTLSAVSRQLLRRKVEAQWAARRQIYSRGQAKDFVAALCVDMGISAANVWSAIERRTPAGLFILHILDTNIEAVFPRNRPRELDRRRMIYDTVNQLIGQGLGETEAFKKAPQILADMVPSIVGPAGKPMTSKSVRQSYRKTDLALIWFEDQTFEERQDLAGPASVGSSSFNVMPGGL